MDVTNSKIDYKLHGFIADNIGDISIHEARNRYNLEQDSMQLAIRTLRYHDRVKKAPTTNHFNEIVYSFLECILGAPKIFQKWNYKIKWHI